MLRRRTAFPTAHCALTLFCACLLTCNLFSKAVAQQTSAAAHEERERGVELYRQGKAKEAIEVLQRAIEQYPDDADAWYYLGLVRNSQAQMTDAQKALGQAVKLWLISPLHKYEQPPRNEEERTFRNQLSAVWFKGAAEKVEALLKLAPDAAPFWREELDTFNFYVRFYEGLRGEALGVFGPGEYTQKARILSRGEPSITEQARKAHVKGTVILRAVLAADGRIKHILVLKPLPHGLTEEAVKAARMIRFVPATRNGQPVSQFLLFEYNFNTH